MFLNRLSKEEKELFLSLAINISKSDGDYSDIEKSMINQYCNEMEIELIQTKLIEDNDVIIQSLSNMTSTYEKKIIVFEIMGLILSDGIFHKEEEKIINLVMQEFKLERSFYESSKRMVEDYYKLQNNIIKLVFDD